MKDLSASQNIKVDVRASALALAEKFKARPTGGNRQILNIGGAVLAFQVSDEFSNTIFKHREIVKELILMAIEELGEGGAEFKSQGMYLVFRFGKPELCKAVYDSTVEGRVAISILWREYASFKAWRDAGDEDLDQDLVNSSVYYLCYELSRYL